MFENKLIDEVHATRYIASWVNVGGTLDRHTGGLYDFQDWLESLGLSNDDVMYISYLAICGRLELETSARQFIKNLNA